MAQSKLPATVDSIVDFFEKDFADIRCQASWDFSGKQLYLGNHRVNKICLALDPIKSVINQAIDRGCELLVTHHPLFFRPSQGLDSANTRDSIVISAIKGDLNILSYHTNLDMAADGLNAHLIRLLSAQCTGVMGEEGGVPHSQLQLYVPESHETQLIDAMAAAGAGQIRNYRRCAFSAKGVSTFTPMEGANPYIGTIDQAVYVNEVCIDMVVPDHKIDAVVAVIRSKHPYEAPAYYVSPVMSPNPHYKGRIGSFQNAVPFENFIERIKKALNIENVLVNMPSYRREVEKFAVITGSGASEWRECLNAGIDLLVTGDMKHHDAVDAREAGVYIVDAGHFATEKIYMTYLAKVLESKFDVKCVEADEEPSIQIL